MFSILFSRSRFRSKQEEIQNHLAYNTDSFAEALTYFPKPADFITGPEEYLGKIQKAKSAVHIPIIASLNGTAIGSWVEYAKKIEAAGADALELNVYAIPTEMDRTSAEIEQACIDIARAVKEVIHIPVAVKLSPFFSNMANMAKRLDQVGVNGLVLFNRFYQPDINLDELEIQTSINLSTPKICGCLCDGSPSCTAGSNLTWPQPAASIAPPTS